MINDTISAISTPLGPGAIGIVRLSGPEAHCILKKIFVPKKALPSKPFMLCLGHVVDPDTSEVLDEVLVSLMKAPISYTREDMAEINSHSGIGILTAILELTLRQGARLARPGEFTYRAFVNGRIDLTQAEAVLDLINSPSQKGLSIATSTLTGKLSQEVESLKEEILHALSELEAMIDFPEEDLGLTLKQVADSLRGTYTKIQELKEAHRSRRVWFEGIHVVIAGRPNAGKSSLLNRLVDSPRAIVTSIPGTTRDLLEVPFLLEGIPLKLIDTAGIGVPRDEAESIGIQRAIQSLGEADIVIYVVDQSIGLSEEDIQFVEEYAPKTILAFNKTDLPLNPCLGQERIPKGVLSIHVSALTGKGIRELKQLIRDTILRSSTPVEGLRICPNLRQTMSLREASHHLENFFNLSEQGLPLDILAEELREAIQRLDELMGLGLSEEVLERIFSSFCVGK